MEVKGRKEHLQNLALILEGLLIVLVAEFPLPVALLAFGAIVLLIVTAGTGPASPMAMALGALINGAHIAAAEAIVDADLIAAVMAVLLVAALSERLLLLLAPIHGVMAIAVVVIVHSLIQQRAPVLVLYASFPTAITVSLSATASTPVGTAATSAASTAASIAAAAVPAVVAAAIAVALVCLWTVVAAAVAAFAAIPAASAFTADSSFCGTATIGCSL